ncbi:MAG: methylthioribose-1-phosphate isomerase [Rhodomicrobium sp.]|nr:MAG: methylthioribose-1-phosphate isomerase [Rhodomicrobium sp.]
MRLNGKPTLTIWLNEDGKTVDIIDQTKLPHQLVVENLKTTEDAARAIKDMLVRGAPLIGATAAYGLCLALHEDASDESIIEASDYLNKQRPTAVNLRWALEVMGGHLKPLPVEQRLEAAYGKAAEIVKDDIEVNRRIGLHGLEIIRKIADKKNGEPVNILTHCNAGWLATTDWGTATSPIYHAHREGIPVHVWVDETRPRNQGAALTAYELLHENVPHTLIVDNAGGHLMQHGKVDICIVGTDRTAANGDVANKIGTYLKALAAHDNNIPFYVGLPTSTIDWTLNSGFDIPIEERSEDEVLKVWGALDDGSNAEVLITAPGVKAANPAFDVTPAKYVTGLITEYGVIEPNETAMAKLKHKQQEARANDTNNLVNEAS